MPTRQGSVTSVNPYAPGLATTACMNPKVSKYAHTRWQIGPQRLIKRVAERGGLTDSRRNAGVSPRSGMPGTRMWVAPTPWSAPTIVSSSNTPCWTVPPVMKSSGPPHTMNSELDANGATLLREACTCSNIPGSPSDAQRGLRASVAGVTDARGGAAPRKTRQWRARASWPGIPPPAVRWKSGHRNTAATAESCRPLAS